MSRAIQRTCVGLVFAGAAWLVLWNYALAKRAVDQTNAPKRATSPLGARSRSNVRDDARDALALRDSLSAEFESIALETPDRNVYLGSKRARELRQRLAALPTAAPAKIRMPFLVDLAASELSLGNVARAVDLYTQAIRLDDDTHLLTRMHRMQLLFSAGVAWLQLGERQNCCAQYGPESCILPIQGGGLHRFREGSTRAADCFRTVVSNTPPESEIFKGAAWLLNAAHMTLGTWPEGVAERFRVPSSALQSSVSFPRFRNVSEVVGLDLLSLAGGVVVADLDGDGDLDVLTSCWDPLRPMHAFRNSGNGTFRDVTARSGLTGELGGLNLRMADYDNDGDIDILVLRGAWLGANGQHPNSLLQNDGSGRFTNVTKRAGMATPAYPTQTGEWADFDGDGDLDLYVGNETTRDFRAPSQLFRNEGDGTFVDIAHAAGVENFRTAKGVTWGDYDNDGDPDLYVSNLDGDNRLYRNAGDGTFQDVANELGVTKPHNSFPVWFFDYNNDGALDLFVPCGRSNAGDVFAYYRGQPTSAEPNRIYRGDGNGGFVDVATQAGFTYPACPMGSNFGDLNGDGYLDFYLGTGNPLYETLVPNLLFLNQAGKTFADVTFASGLGHLQKGHGVAFADFDEDGDVDILAQMGGAFPGDTAHDTVYQNPGFDNAWLGLRLQGTQANRSAIGARIHVRFETPDGPRSVYRDVNSGGSFGTNPLRQTIGLGAATRILFVAIRWPASKDTQRFEDVPLNRAFRAIQGDDTLQPASRRAGIE